MRIYVWLPETNSHSLWRVDNMVRRYAPPGVEFVDDRRQADLMLLHVVGRRDAVNREADRGLPFVAIQYCVRSTQLPDTAAWLPIWRKAKIVWSYLDLYNLCRQDGNRPHFHFYHTPLGVDDVFSSNGLERDYLIATSGPSELTESVRECARAAKAVGGKVFHLGPDLKSSAIDTYSERFISDETLAAYFGRCRFVSGLRRIEGFELPAAEGLCCGARPLFFDRPHYRKWFDPWGVFIPEEPRPEVLQSLVSVFQTVNRPVTEAEIADARELFSWSNIIEGFWECVN